MFEFTISKQELLPPLLTVAGAVDKKQSLAILSNILLTLTEQQLILTATDLEIEITASFSFHSSQGTGAVTVPAKKMIDLVRSLDEDAIPRFSVDNGVVTIKQGRSQFKITTLAADDYPSTQDEVNELEFSLSKADLIRVIQSTHFAMSQQDVRVFLNGMLLEFDSQYLTSVATDGHRLAICRLPCPFSTPFYRLLLPRKGVHEILRLLNTVTDDSISISAGKNHFKLVTTQYTFLTRLIDARFPPYIKAIPNAQDKQVIIDRDLLKRSLSRIIILANEKSRAILLHVQKNQLTLIANNQEQEEAIEELSAETEGEEIKIGVNANYLLDVLGYLQEGPLRLSFSNTDSSILVESPQDTLYFYIIMPMKI